MMKRIVLSTLFIISIQISFSQDSIKFELIKNINTKPFVGKDGSSYPLNLIVANEKLFFTAVGDSIGRELFITDGTENGTRLLKNINSYHQIVSSDSDNSSDPDELSVFGDKIIFVANDDIHGYEPWVSDGTTNGTFLLDVTNSNSDSYPRSFTGHNDLVFFIADTRFGRQLFISDGTLQGTVIVKEITGGDTYGGPFKVFKNKLYYNYTDYQFGNELWCSDGTASGTSILKDINSKSGSYPTNFFEFNNKLFFSAEDDSLGRELWSTDGTEQNTTLVYDINMRPGIGSFPKKFTSLNNNLYFIATDSSHGTELWTLNKDTIFMVLDISPDYGALSYSNLHVFNNRLYFSVKMNEFSDPVLWTSDGTAQGTHEFLASDSSKIENPKAFVNWQNRLVFIGQKFHIRSNQLWISDGTEINTKQLFNDSITGWNPIKGEELIIFNDDIYFSADFVDSMGIELYKITIDTTSVIPNLTSKLITEEKIKVYPNPFHNRLMVEFDNAKYNKLICIFDMTGRVVFSKKSDCIKDEIKLPSLKNGVYLLRIIDSNKIYVKKIIKG